MDEAREEIKNIIRNEIDYCEFCGTRMFMSNINWSFEHTRYYIYGSGLDVTLAGYGNIYELIDDTEDLIVATVPDHMDEIITRLRGDTSTRQYG